MCFGSLAGSAVTLRWGARVIMAREKQKKVARLLIANATLDKPLNGGEILANSGYSESMQTNPKVVLESAGVQEELKVLGFDALSAKKVVQEIMLDSNVDPMARLKATDQVFKVTGEYAPEKQDINAKINHNIIEMRDYEDEASDK